MSLIARKVSNLARQGRKNVIELFTGPSQEHLIDSHGNMVVIDQKIYLLSNPFTALSKMKGMDWAFFSCGFFALFVDMLDIFSLAVQTSKIAHYYHTDKATIASAITYAMLSRWVGALMFGLLGDFTGRKYPMILNCVLMGVMQVATIYSTSLGAFLATRAIFGFTVGGLWGLAASTAMEQCDVEARGLLSGIFESAASVGYIGAAAINYIVGDKPSTWTTSFWVGAGLSWVAALYRLCLPESTVFLRQKQRSTSIKRQPKLFVKQLMEMFKQEWGTISYTIILVALMTCVLHSATDSYTTFLLDSKSMSNKEASKGSMIMKSGGVAGAPFIGWISQAIGRRRGMVICGIMICLLIPWWILPDNPAILFSGGFMFVFFLQGLTGILPIHLSELASPKFRALIAGLSFQIGGTISAPTAQIINAVAEKHFGKNKNGKVVESYGPIMAGFSATCALLIVIWAAIGPERRNSRFDLISPAGFEDEDETEELALHHSNQDQKIDVIKQNKDHDFASQSTIKTPYNTFFPSLNS